MANLKTTVEIPVWTQDARGEHHQTHTLTVTTAPEPNRDWMIELRGPAVRKDENTLAVWVTRSDLTEALSKLRHQV